MDRLGRDDPLSVGPYRLTRRLGAGGMGRVYLAHTPGGYPVAVKVAHRHIAVDHRFRSRFRREIDAALRVSGLYTARVVEADPEAELPWMATEYIEGPTLDQRLARGHLDPTELGRLGSALAEALTAIHECALVHRDLKPSNIIMAANGPRVIDFGIAHAMDAVRTTTPGRTLGTHGYIAPEQSSGVVRPASDVYALGMVLVHAAGGDPFDQGGRGMRRPYHEPDLTALPAAMRPFVGRCLDPRPERRPQPSELIRAFSPDPAVPRQWPAVATSAPPGPPADRDERSETAPPPARPAPPPASAPTPHAPPPPPLPAWPDAPTQTAPPPARPEPDAASGAVARTLPGPITAVEFRMSRLRRLQVATESLVILLLPPVLLAAAGSATVWTFTAGVASLLFALHRQAVVTVLRLTVDGAHSTTGMVLRSAQHIHWHRVASVGYADRGSGRLRFLPLGDAAGTGPRGAASGTFISLPDLPPAVTPAYDDTGPTAELLRTAVAGFAPGVPFLTSHRHVDGARRPDRVPVDATLFETSLRRRLGWILLLAAMCAGHATAVATDHPPKPVIGVIVGVYAATAWLGPGRTRAVAFSGRGIHVRWRRWYGPTASALISWSDIDRAEVLDSDGRPRVQVRLKHHAGHLLRAPGGRVRPAIRVLRRPPRVGGRTAGARRAAYREAIAAHTPQAAAPAEPVR